MSFKNKLFLDDFFINNKVKNINFYIDLLIIFYNVFFFTLNKALDF